MEITVPGASPFHSMRESPLRALDQEVITLGGSIAIYSPLDFFFIDYTEDLHQLWDATVGYDYVTRYKYIPGDVPEAGGTEQLPVGFKFAGVELPITWAISGGALPDGLSLVDDDPDDDIILIEGTPTDEGEFDFTVTALKDGDPVADYEGTIRVYKPLTISNFAELNTYWAAEGPTPGLVTDGTLLAMTSPSTAIKYLSWPTNWAWGLLEKPGYFNQSYLPIEVAGSPRWRINWLVWDTRVSLFALYLAAGTSTGALLYYGNADSPLGTYTIAPTYPAGAPETLEVEEL